MTPPSMLHDVFICHANEDKAAVVRPLANALVAEGVAVWYDEFALRLGDSLRAAIDQGLRTSRFGIVVLSPDFFSKNWPQYELDGLVTREMAGNDRVLLPIWHQVDAQEVARHSPSLAGRFAVSTQKGIPDIVTAIVQILRPEGSPLIVARDELLAWGVSPPVITDQYWLDVVEASNRVPATGAVAPIESTWGRWSFPLPESDGTPVARGIRLAWTAMQLAWTQDADERAVDLATEPERVLTFIQEHPGLEESCRYYPGLLAEYAPQLTIPGLGGHLEPMLEEAFRGAAKHELDEEWCLRTPSFDGATPYEVAHAYFSGGIFGPEVRLHEHADYLFWLLSSDCEWLPVNTRDVLRLGLSQMTGGWLWHRTPSEELSQDWPARGALYDAYHEAIDQLRHDVVWTERVRADLQGRARIAQTRLRLRASPTSLVDAFVQLQVMARALEHDREIREQKRGRP